MATIRERQRSGPITGRRLRQAQKRSERGTTFDYIARGVVSRQRRWLLGLIAAGLPDDPPTGTAGTEDDDV